MSNVVINLQKLTAPVGIVVSTAWVTVNNGLGSGVGFLLAVSVFYFILVGIEFLYEDYMKRHF